MFDGDIAANTISLKQLVTDYTTALYELAVEYSEDQFAVEVIPALEGLPPAVEAGSDVIDKNALTLDCFHYTGDTQGQVGVPTISIRCIVET